MDLEVKLCSSLVKVMPECGAEVETTCGTALQGERFSFQLAYTSSGNRGRLWVSCVSALPVRCRKVELVPVRFNGVEIDDDVVGKTPGLYPDLLTGLDNYGTELPLMRGQYRSGWFTVEVPEDCAPGKYEIVLDIKAEDYSGETCTAQKVFTLEVLDVRLPETPLKYTCWLHGDCIATSYGLEIFSEKYWEYLEKFIRSAVRNGVNMLLIPVVTPPLDTEIGGERPTNQLVKIVRTAAGYGFDFSRVKRFVTMAQSCGIKYFEVPPLFTQWGAAAAPKIMAECDGGEVQIFGWDTRSDSPEYREFLKLFLKEFTAMLKAEKWDKLFSFHCSDEPGPDHLETFRDCQEFLQKELQGFTVMDALSSVDFYRQKVIQTPVVSERKMDEFLEAGMEPGWIYYCCNPQTVFPNRFIYMTSSRNRVMGMLLYRYHVTGFLHWGFNFYYSYHSRYPVNPYFTTDCGGTYPSGDAFLVYPGADGEPEESIRSEVFHEGLQDLRALELLESLSSREAVEAMLDSFAPGGRLKLDAYPQGEAAILRIRDEINRRIKELTGK